MNGTGTQAGTEVRAKEEVRSGETEALVKDKTRGENAVVASVKEDVEGLTTPTAALLEILPAKRQNSFIMKLYNMLNLNEYPDIVRWNRDGTFFIIEKRQEFISIVLKKYFGGVKMSSFLRQLNMYSFTKDPHGIQYSHPYFTKANPILLKLIKRRQFPASVKVEYHPPIDSGGLQAATAGMNSASMPVMSKSSSQTSLSVRVEEDNNETLPTYSSNRPIVSPHYPPPRAQLSAEGVCRRCAQVEHLFAQEDPFKGVFEEEENINTIPTRDTFIDSADTPIQENIMFATTNGFSAFKFKPDSKYLDSKDLYVEDNGATDH